MAEWTARAAAGKGVDFIDAQGSVIGTLYIGTHGAGDALRDAALTGGITPDRTRELLEANNAMLEALRAEKLKSTEIPSEVVALVAAARLVMAEGASRVSLQHLDKAAEAFAYLSPRTDDAAIDAETRGAA